MFKTDFLKKLDNLKSVEAIYDVIYDYWGDFERNNINIDEFFEKYYLNQNIFDKVFKNTLFIESLITVAKKYHSSRKNFTVKTVVENYPCVKENTIINSFILLLGFPLSYIYDKLSERQIALLRNNISLSLKSVENTVNYLVSYSEISTILNYSSQNLAYCYHPKNFPKIYGLDWMTLLSKLKCSRIFMSAIYIIIPEIFFISSTLNEFSSYKSSHPRTNLPVILSNLYKASAKTTHSLTHLNREYLKVISNDSNFIKFIDIFKTVNEKVINIIIMDMTFGITDNNPNDSNDFSKMILKKVSGLDQIISNIKLNCTKLLSAYSSEENRGEWSNKIFITTIKTLSALSVVSKANNDLWKIKVIVKEYYNWIDNINEIINKNIIDDDWKIIKDLVNEENANVEWKSSFFTPIQNEEIIYSDSIFLLIIKNIIGMMNSNGGHILVGRIENLEYIKNKEIKKHIFTKNSINFFDIKYEFQISKEINSFDKLKRRIQDHLTQLTGKETSYFDSYWKIKEIFIRIDGFTYTNYLIEVKKLLQLTFCIADKSKKLFYLIKRLNGKTENIDIQSYLKLPNTTN